MVELLRKWHHWRSGKSCLPVWRPLASSPYLSCYRVSLLRVGRQRVAMRFWLPFQLLRSRVCYQPRRSVMATTSQNVLLIVSFPMKFNGWCVSLSQNRSIDAKLCQHSVTAPFPQTVYSVRSVHKPSSWESGLYWSKVSWMCAAGGQMVQTSVLWSWQCEWSYLVHASLDRGGNPQKDAPQQAVRHAVKALTLHVIPTTEICPCPCRWMGLLASSCWISWLFKKACSASVIQPVCHVHVNALLWLVR